LTRVAPDLAARHAELGQQLTERTAKADAAATRAKKKPWQETARKKTIGSETRRLHARNEIEQQCSRSSGLFGTMPKPGERTKTAPDDNGLSTTYQKETAPCVDAML
jgi:hypothetical protein